MFSDPLKNLKQFGVSEDMIVADLGAGSGFYSMLVSKMVPKGKVYAIEVVPDYLQSITNKIKEAKITNLECFLGDVETIGGTKLKDGIANAVIASNILFQIEDKSKFVGEIKRILAPNGKVLLIDWEAVDSILSENMKGAVPKESARDLFEKNGFRFDREIDAGEHHYGMIFRI
jgi:ubiquinone/menaquinone biosynthesis C-methylase UbiE